MSDKVSIDDFFRQNLLDAREPNHLGAWANMQQMLDGKNPYAKKDNRYKYLGFLLLFIGLGAGSVAVKNFIDPSPAHIASSQSSMVLASNELKGKFTKGKTSEERPEEVTKSVEQTINSSTQPRNIQSVSHNDHSVAKAMSLSSVQNAHQENAIQHTSQASHYPQSNINQKYTNNSKSINYNNKEKELIAQNSAQAVVNEAKMYSHASSAEYPTIQSQQAILQQAKPETKKEIAKKNPRQSTQAEGTQNRFIATQNVSIHNQETVNEAVAKNPAMVSKRNLETNSMSTARLSSPILQLQELIGLPAQAILYTKEVNQSIHKLNSTQPTITAWNIDHIYAELESDIGAKQMEASNMNQPAYTLKSSKAESQDIQSARNTSREDTSKKVRLTKAATPTALSAMSAGIITGIKEAMETGRYKLGHMSIPVNPGFFAGINGSFLNTDHDAGGFQLATNLLMDISKKWYLVPGLGFYYRNNGGYSVYDNSILIGNKQTVQIDSNRYAYSYTKDSSIFTHNFKHYYTIESPLLLEYKLKNKGIYGGLNIAYGFKMKTQEKRTTYSSFITDTLASTSFQFPSDKLNYYKSVDFNSRLGVGYVFGFNTTFSQRLFFDARFVQNVYDNSTTQSAVAMSKKFFRAASIQLNLGYRFRDRR